MRTVSRFVLLSIVLGSGFAIAAPPASTGKGKAEVPPPPGINDPGVSTPPAAQGSAAAPDEVLAVVAHEIGHYKCRHVQWGLALAVVHTGVLFFLLSLVLRTPPLFAAFASGIGPTVSSQYSTWSAPRDL